MISPLSLRCFFLFISFSYYVLALPSNHFATRAGSTNLKTRQANFQSIRFNGNCAPYRDTVEKGILEAKAIAASALEQLREHQTLDDNGEAIFDNNNNMTIGKVMRLKLFGTETITKQKTLIGVVGLDPSLLSPHLTVATRQIHKHR